LLSIDLNIDLIVSPWQHWHLRDVRVPSSLLLSLMALFASCAPTEVSVVEPNSDALCEVPAKTVARLTRQEANNIIRDLFALRADGAVLPAEAGGAFDNDTGGLSVSFALVDAQRTWARDIAALVMPRWTPLGASATGTCGEFGCDGGLLTWTLPRGPVDIRFTAYGQGTFDVAVDGVVFQTVAFNSAALAIELRTPVDGRVLTIQPDATTYLRVDGAQVRFNDGVDRRGAWIPCDASVVGVSTCADDAFRVFLPRAFRRPAGDDDRAPLIRIVVDAVANGETFDEGMSWALEALLRSPSFWFRPEPSIGVLGAHELAARLSFFLWASMPDDELRVAADDGSLREPAVLLATTRRMLHDPRVDGGLLDALASQWLRTRQVQTVSRDARYPFSAEIAASMQRETLLVLRDLLLSDRPFTDAIDLPYTFVDAVLATHYGLPFDAAQDGNDGLVDGFVKVDTTAVGRAGVLNQGAFLTSTSFFARTSPVLRGLFIARNILCLDPGEVPADVPAFNEDDTTGSLRDRMERHRSDPNCASCHTLMDPLGFGLESFDAVGRSRTTDLAGFAIEDDDVFFDMSFDGPLALAALVKNQPQTSTCLMERVTSYALGRGFSSFDTDPNHPDVCLSRELASASASASLQTIVEAVVMSNAFLLRTSEGL
jgi:Protein of unknown function (DUF1592)/Protein of unknown function (DUF1588)/Protein of unknown function (DUF1595)/Protein of unknown function (DUF1585)/Protein of unknown function (DUF1587)